MKRGTFLNQQSERARQAVAPSLRLPFCTAPGVRELLLQGRYRCRLTVDGLRLRRDGRLEARYCRRHRAAHRVYLRAEVALQRIQPVHYLVRPFVYLVREHLQSFFHCHFHFANHPFQPPVLFVHQLLRFQSLGLCLVQRILAGD